mmetsp:Transcript_20092/g.46819  ORF Transcript_20092/g.46819 Transcript_20092/m.46819 type:complete len:739 (-) Transcript_20092:47-2263(-)
MQPPPIVSLTRDPTDLPKELLDEYEALTKEPLGVGAFAIVRLLRHRQSGELYALKIIEKHPLRIRNMLSQMQREVTIQQRLNHPNILKLVKAVEDQGYSYMLLEYCAKGQLRAYVAQQPDHRLSEDRAAHYFVQIVSGVEWMHRNACVHRDLKLENMLLTEDDVVKICDFGWSAEMEVESLLKTTCGTTAYWAPEIWQGMPQDESVDLWSLGCMLYEVLAGHPPFWGHTQEELKQKAVASRFGCPPWFSAEACDIVRQLLKPDPKDRIRCIDLLRHDWLSKNAPVATAAALRKVDASQAAPPLKEVVQAAATSITAPSTHQLVIPAGASIRTVMPPESSLPLAAAASQPQCTAPCPARTAVHRAASPGLSTVQHAKVPASPILAPAPTISTPPQDSGSRGAVLSRRLSLITPPQTGNFPSASSASPTTTVVTRTDMQSAKSVQMSGTASSMQAAAPAPATRAARHSMVAMLPVTESKKEAAAGAAAVPMLRIPQGCWAPSPESSDAVCLSARRTSASPSKAPPAHSRVSGPMCAAAPSPVHIVPQQTTKATPGSTGDLCSPAVQAPVVRQQQAPAVVRIASPPAASTAPQNAAAAAKCIRHAPVAAAPPAPVQEATSNSTSLGLARVPSSSSLVPAQLSRKGCSVMIPSQSHGLTFASVNGSACSSTAPPGAIGSPPAMAFPPAPATASLPHHSQCSSAQMSGPSMSKLHGPRRSIVIGQPPHGFLPQHPHAVTVGTE